MLPSEAVAMAFASGEYVAETAVKEFDIEAAADRYIIPIAGRALYEAMLDGRYNDLKTNYVQPTVALGVRVLLQRQLNVRTGQMGLSLPATTGSGTVAVESAADELQRSVRHRLQTLRKRLSDYLNDHADLFPEYEPRRNALNRTRVDGGLVQIC